MNDTAPVANAGTPQTVAVGRDGVTLDGSASADPDSGPSPLTYAWTQTGGPDGVPHRGQHGVAELQRTGHLLRAQTLTFQLDRQRRGPQQLGHGDGQRHQAGDHPEDRW